MYALDFESCCHCTRGTAAALAARETAGDVHALDVTRLRARLRERRVMLDPALVAPAP